MNVENLMRDSDENGRAGGHHGAHHAQPDVLGNHDLTPWR